MKKQTLASRYNSRKNKLPKYAIGGAMDAITNNKLGMSSALGLASSVGGELIDAFGAGKTKVGGALSSGLKMASAGAAFGPLGAAIGGGLGLVTGFLGASKQQQLERQQRRLESDRKNQASLMAGQAAIANDPSIIYGNDDAEMYADGGTIDIDYQDVTGPGPGPKKPKSITTTRGNVVTDDDLAKTFKATGLKWNSKEEYGNWVDKFAKPVPENKSSVTYPFGKRGETMTQAEWDYVREKRGYPDVYSDKVQGTDNFIPGEIYSNAVRNDVAEYRARNKKMANGGQVDPKKPIKGDGSFVGNLGAKVLNRIQSPEAEKSLKRFQEVGGKAVMTGLNLLDRTGVSNYPDVYKSFAENEPGVMKALNLAGAIPVVGGPIKAGGKAIRASEFFPKAAGFAGDAVNAVVDFAKGSNPKKEMGGGLSNRYYKANGGTLDELNSSTVEVDGKSHAQGGVQIPGAEVEDGETISNGFVFSERLGFAEQHKPIAKAMGKIEKKVNSPVRDKSLEILKKKEEALALSQEFFKQQMGIPSDLDNTEV